MSIVVKKITLTAVLATLSTLTFMLESLFPPLIIPGAKLGLSNLFILLTAITIGYKYSFAVLIVKCLIGSLFSGNFATIIYSLPAGLIALTIEILLLTLTKKISIVSISTLGAVINSSVQNLTFCIVTNTFEYLIYLPYLALIAVIAGLLVGFTLHLLIKKLPEKVFGITQINN